MDAENRNATHAPRCLCGDTVLQTADGPRPIEDLAGERPFLFASHPDDGHVNLVQADRVFVSDRERPVVRVALDDGSSLDCTPEHPFMLEDGSFEEAHRLREGSYVRVLDEAMKRLSFTEMHVRTIGETGHRKTAPSAGLAEPAGGGSEWQGGALLVDPAAVRAPAGADLDYGAKLVAFFTSDPAPPRIYGGRDSTTRRVVGVEELPGRAREVYDVSLPILHNFAAGGAGTFVHNCGHSAASWASAR